MAIEIGKKYCLLTKNPYLVDEHTADYAEVIDIKLGTTDVSLPERIDHIQDVAEVRFPNGDTAFVHQTDLVNPENVPFKKGDEVKNTVYFNTPMGATGWPGIRWKIRQVTYGMGKDNGFDLEHAVMVCDSYDYALWGYMFFSNQLEKV